MGDGDASDWADFRRLQGGTLPTCSGYLVKIVGTGHAGIKAVNALIDSGQHDAEFIAVDTDRQSLEQSKAMVKVELNVKPVKGLCRGVPDPEVGRGAAEDSSKRLFTALHGADLVFVIAGAGGAAGTGGAPVIARIASKSGVPLTIGVVSQPFPFQSRGIFENAEDGISNLRGCVDALIIVPGDHVFQIDQAPQMNILDACHLMDNALGLPVQCILDLIRLPSLIDHDMADLRWLFRSGTGIAPIGTVVVSYAGGEKWAAQAARTILSTPFLDRTLREADAMLVVFKMAAETFRFSEMIEAADTVIRAVRPGARVAYNTRFEDKPAKDVSVTAIWVYDTVL